MKKRIALLLSLSMLAGSLYVPAYAADQNEEANDIVEISDEPFIEEDFSESQEENVQEIEILGEEEGIELPGVNEDSEEVGETGTDETAEIAEPEEEILGEPDDPASFSVSACISAGARMNTILVYNDYTAPVYAAVIDPDDHQISVSGNSVKGVMVEAQGRLAVTEVTGIDNSKKPIEYSKGYLVYVSLSEDVELTRENLVYGDSEDPLIYTDEKNFNEVAVPADAATLKDGALIGLSAMVQKNNTIKFKWSNKAESKTYKTFELSRLKSDGTWDVIMPSSSKKAFVQGVEGFQNFTDSYVEVYKLACTGDGAVDNYVTAAAPMIYYAESGDVENSMDLAFTKVTPSNILGYDMEISTDKKFTSSKIDHEDSIEINTIDFTISKKATAKAARSDFYVDGFTMTPGTTYYCRVKTTVSMGSVSVCSVPSPVKAVKQGPKKCDFWGFWGLTPEGKTSIGDSWSPSVSQCYAVFTGPEPSKVKGYELVVSDTSYGVYKVYKKIPASAVKPYYPPQFKEEGWTFDDGEQFYYFIVNDLPPMSRYYSVRAISLTGNARGGFSDGIIEAGQYSKVQDVQVTNSDVSSITLSFKGESGVKEYWIYRDTVSDNLTKELTPSMFVGKVSNKFKKPGQSGTLVFKDKKGLTKNTPYFYTVRPVYSKKFANVQKFDFNYDEQTGKYSYGYGESLSDLVSGKASLENAVVKNVKASVLSVKDVQITWSSVKGATKYTIYYVEGREVNDASQIVKIATVEKGSSEFSSRKVKVQVPKVGQKYIFVINVGDEAVSSNYGSITEAVSTHPANPTNLETNYYKHGNRAAKLTWTNPQADREYRNNIYYDIVYRDGDSGSWKDLATVRATQSSYVDDKNLDRGIQRQYSLKAVYTDDKVTASNPKYTSYVKFCKPYRIAVTNSSKDSVGTLTINEGETYTLRVYFYDRYGDNDMVTDKKFDILKSSDSSIASISSTGKEGNYVTVKVNAKTPGTCKLTIGARDYDDDDNRLLKKVTVKVRSSVKK
ncbi:MAG: hypothetical protein IJM23_04000 [Lachnospiraceae bacterium]|nr:hypothetical protein [Lachnospiraceae bacterium]